MNTECKDAHKAKPPKKFFAVILEIIFIGAAIASFLRVFGVVDLRSMLIDSGLETWEVFYLISAGTFLTILNIIAWINSHCDRFKKYQIAWIFVLVNIIWYWLERILIWSVDQRSGNWLFMLCLHAAWMTIAVLLLFESRKMKKG